MDAVFERIYASQIQVYRETQSSLFAPRGILTRAATRRARKSAMYAVDRAVDLAIEKLDPRFSVRSDARLFLIVNLAELVAIPLFSDVRTRHFDAVEDTLLSDASTIIEAAKQYAFEGREVSAAAVLFGAAKVLPNLRLKEWRFWDPP